MGKISQPTTPSTPDRAQAEPSQSVLNEVEAPDIDISSTPELNLTNEAIRLISLKQDLGVDASDTDHDSELKGILEWAKEVGIKNKNQLSAKLREVRYKLGVQENKDAIKSIYQYIRIDSQIKSLVNKQETLHAKRN